MIVFTRRPDRIQETFTSKWNCSRQPILFELHRQDFSLISVNAGLPGTTVVKAVYDASLIASLNVGDYIYFETNINPATNQAANYGVSARVTAIAAAPPAYILIYVDYTAEIASGNGGFLNLVSRANYYLVATLYVTDMNTGIVHPVLTKLKPGIDGRMRLDASEFVNGYMKKLMISVTGENQHDPLVYGKYYISYGERWTGYTGSEIIDGNGEYYFVDAAKELGSAHGQNLLDYLTQGEEITPYPKFLTDFATPSYFLGYPFDLSVILNNAETIGITREEDEYTIGGSSLTTRSTALVTNQQPAVHRVKLSGSFTTGTAYVDVYLKANSIVQEGYHENYYHDPDYFDTIPPSGSITPYQMTEKKRVNIVQPCGSHPVYVRWRNKKGGWDAWLFEKNQSVRMDARIDGEFQSDPYDIQTATHRATIIDTIQSKRISCGATVSISDAQAIAGIEGSPAIFILVDANTDTWVRMKQVPKGVQYQTKGATTDIQIELEYPEPYTISN